MVITNHEPQEATMNDRESDATNGTGPDTTPHDAAPRPTPADAPPTSAHALPHVTGSSDARYVSQQSSPEPQAPTWMSAPGTAPVPPTFSGPAAARRRPRRWMVLTGAAAAIVVGVGGAGAGAWAVGNAAGVAAAGAAATAASQQQALELAPQLLGPQSGDATSPFGGTQGGTGTPQQQETQGGTGSSETAATAATAEETQGVVTIVSTLNYDDSYKSAGTGMIMTAGGLILTNNHVVQGATSIEVTDETTGRTYTADVVGTDATNDVAVLQLQDASGLTPATFDTSSDVATGDAVHSTGNAGGTGDLVTATGTVLATDQAIQVQSESGSGSESLSGLIEVQSDVVSGDSGGPLRDADGDVVGIVTAASSGTTPITGYAIPIDDAMAIAKQIVAGQASSTIQIGLPAFLGAQIDGTTSGTGTGVVIAGTVAGSAAESAGLVAGDTITGVDGTAVTSASSLTAAIQAHASGDQVSIAWTDAAGASHTQSVTLGDGPAA